MVKKIRKKSNNKTTDNTISFSMDVFNIIRENSWLSSRLKILPKEVSNIFYTIADKNLSVAVHIDRIVKQNINLDTNALRYRQWILTPQEMELMCMFQILPDEAEVQLNEQHIPEPVIETPKIEIVKG